MTSDAPLRHERLLLALTLVVGALVRVREALRTPLWFDELYSLSAVQRSFEGMIEVVRQDVHPPLHLVLTWLWMRAGDSDLWVREASIVAGLAGIAAVWALARELAGPRAGLLAAALAALHPWHVHISQEARPYAMLWLTLTLAAWTAWRLASAPGRGRLVAYAVAAAAAMWTHYLAGVVVAVIGLWGLGATFRHPERRRAWLGGNAAALALFAPLVPLLLRQIGRARADHWVPPPSPADLLDIGQRIASGPPLVAFAVLALALLPLARPGRRREAAFVWTVGAGGVLACWLLGIAGFRMFAVKYVLFALPFAAVVLALGAERVGPRPLRALVRVAMIAILARALWLRPPHAEAASFGMAARALAGVVAPGDVVFHGDTHTWFWGRRYLPQARHALLLMGRPLPYFEGAGLVPEAVRVPADSLDRTAARGDRWWALTVHKAGLDAALAAARLDQVAAAPPETLGLVRLWWSHAAGPPRLTSARRASD